MAAWCAGCAVCGACSIAALWCGVRYGALGGAGVIGLTAW